MCSIILCFCISHTFLTSYCALSAVVNYLALLTAGTALTFVLYELLRRVPVVRFLVLGQRKRDT